MCEHRTNLDREFREHYAAHPEMICARCWLTGLVVLRGGTWVFLRGVEQ